MYKLPQDQDAPDEVIMDEKAGSAFHSGFLQLETPSPVAHIETNVKNQLTSGTDFDPLPQQIARRVTWMVVPAIVSFFVVTGILALRPIPRVPLNQWLERHGVVYKAKYVSDRDEIYTPPAHLKPLTVPADGFSTQISGTDPPLWFRKPLVHTRASLEGTKKPAVGHAAGEVAAPAKQVGSGPHPPILRAGHKSASHSEVTRK